MCFVAVLCTASNHLSLNTGQQDGGHTEKKIAGHKSDRLTSNEKCSQALSTVPVEDAMSSYLDTQPVSLWQG